MQRLPLRGLAAATIATLGLSGVALSVNAWAEEPAAPVAARTAPVVPTEAERAERAAATEARVARAAASAQADVDQAWAQAEAQRLAWIEATRAAEAQVAAEQAAAQAAREQAEREAAEREEAEREAAEQEEAQREEAQREEAARERSAADDRASRSGSRSSGGSAKSIAADMVAARGWSSSQFDCLDQLWQKESGWRVSAANPSSGAYGIPQSLPASKMASSGSDYRTNAATQIDWGLGYIAGRYGTPCGAWEHSRANNWY